MTNWTLFDTRLLGAAALLGALGCGAGGIAADGGETGETGEAGDGDGDGDGDTGDGDGDTSEGDGDGDGDGEVPADACVEDGQLARPLAIVDSSAAQVHVLAPGGAALILPATLPAGVDAPANVHASAAGDYLAVTSNYTIFIEPGVSEEGALLRLYSWRTGELLWQREFVDRQLGQVFVDDEGRVVATMGWSPTPAPPIGLLVIDGELIELPNFAPSGPLGSNDWIVGRVVDDLGEHLGAAFYQPFSSALIEVTQSFSQSFHARDEIIEYIDDGPSVPEFVLARPDGEQRIELSPLAGLDGTLSMTALAGDYRLLELTTGDDAPPMLLRLQVSTQELLTIDVTPPAGLESFDCYFQRTSVDADGRILFELRDAGAAQVHAWAPEREQWIALGVPMTAVDDIGVDARFGRVELIQAHGSNTTFCPPAEWTEPPADALAGSSVQLARIDPPLSVVIETQPFNSIVVDRAERCATWIDERGQQVRDLDDDDQLTLEVSGVALWLD